MAIVLALATLALAAVAVALGIRAGNLKSERDAARRDHQTALTALGVQGARTLELEALLAERDRELQSLYDELETCGDPETRSRAAIAGIRILLPPKATEAGTADPD